MEHAQALLKSLYVMAMMVEARDAAQARHCAQQLADAARAG